MVLIMDTDNVIGQPLRAMQCETKNAEEIS